LVGNISDVNEVDEHGMTPLEHAAYRGNRDMCQLLLDCGARINDGTRNNGYTALHFAALSGNSLLCQLLLQHGAKAEATNSVGRTAAQMSAFVGNHNCVSTINTYVDRLDVEYFSERRGLESAWHLKQILVAPVHSLITQVNFHPVKLALLVKQSDVLLNEMQNVLKVLPMILEREVKKGIEMKETVAVKIHLIWYTLMQLQKESMKAKGKDPIESFIKRMLKCNKQGGIPENLDVLLREGVRSFQYHETGIMQQLVTSLNHTKVSEDPGAWGIICRLINGQKGFQDVEPCCVCGEESGVKRCGGCHSDTYCGKDCQRFHWFVHKKYCRGTSELDIATV